MINETLADLYAQLGHTVTVVDRGTGEKRTIIPTAEDVEKMLDSAAGALYTEPVGTRFNVGHLIIEKLENNQQAVFVHVADYS